MQCPKCSSECREAEVEGRMRIKCTKCSYLSYERRGVSGPYQEMADKIADHVARDGAFTIMAVELINGCFRSVPDGVTSQALMDQWCKLHDFEWDVDDSFDSNRKPAQFVRFYRR